MRPESKSVFWLACCGVPLLVTDLLLPLRVPEILQVLAAWRFSGAQFLGWIVQTPDSAPLSYFVQLPLLLIWPNGRLAARLPSLVFAIAACIVLFYLLKEISVRREYLAVAAFLLLPLHFQSATDARGFEQALFLTVLAIFLFFRLIRTPSVKTSVLYGLVLTLGVYTEPYSFLPAIGQFLFLLRFVGRPQERRAVWFALPPTAAPLLLFLPYYLWARLQTNSNWISVPAMESRDLAAYGLLILLGLGLLVAVANTFRGMTRNPSKRILLFCVAGGVVSSIAGGQILWAAPGLILLFFAALEWLSTSRMKRTAASAVAVLAIACSIPSIVKYLTFRGENLEGQAAAVSSRLANGSCVVFLSEGLSKDLFTLFQPQLADHECLNFFHRRVIIATHPYVSLKWRTDADSYFHALNFHEQERLRIGTGEIVVLEPPK
jgi:hypothetical protein